MSSFLGKTVINTGLNVSVKNTVCLDINDGLKNGLVRCSYFDDAPVLEFPKRTDGRGKIKYSLSTKDFSYDGENLIIKIFWSVKNNNSSGNVKWKLKYKAIKTGLDTQTIYSDEILSSQLVPISNSDIMNTGSVFNLSGNIKNGDILTLDLERDSEDSCNSDARIHLIRVENI